MTGPIPTIAEAPLIRKEHEEIKRDSKRHHVANTKGKQQLKGQHLPTIPPLSRLHNGARTSTIKAPLCSHTMTEGRTRTEYLHSSEDILSVSKSAEVLSPPDWSTVEAPAEDLSRNKTVRCTVAYFMGQGSVHRSNFQIPSESSIAANRG